MRRIARVGGIAVAVSLLGSQFVRPARTNPPTDPDRTLAAARHVPAEVAATLDRACRDCHSNETQWPWYSTVAPISWFVIDHVNHGRSHFNYSEWSRYDEAEATRLLTNACRLAREREMPLSSYTLMHRKARLTRADVDALCSWTQ
jgi:Haem-binding domain